jgi:hypothetical protein
MSWATVTPESPASPADRDRRGRQPSSNIPPDPESDAAIPLIQVEHFAGAIDDVLIQDWAPPDTSSIQALFAGRYNINDLIFRPGQEVDYRSTLENSLLARRISGQRQIDYPAQLTDASSGLTPFVLDAAQKVTYPDDFTVAPTAASGKYTITQRVDGAISIPAEDVWVTRRATRFSPGLDRRITPGHRAPAAAASQSTSTTRASRLPPGCAPPRGTPPGAVSWAQQRPEQRLPLSAYRRAQAEVWLWQGQQPD